MALVLENGVWKLQPGGATGPTTTTYSPNGDGEATLGTADADGFRTITNTGLDGLYVWDPSEALDTIEDTGTVFQFTNGTAVGGNYPFESWQFLGNDVGIVLILGQQDASSCAVEATVSAAGSTSTSFRYGAGIFQYYPASAVRNNSAGVTVYGQASSILARAYDDGSVVNVAVSSPSLPATLRTELNYTAGTFRESELDFKVGGVSQATYEGTPYSRSAWLGFAIGTIVASTVDVTSFSVTV